MESANMSYKNILAVISNSLAAIGKPITFEELDEVIITFFDEEELYFTYDGDEYEVDICEGHIKVHTDTDVIVYNTLGEVVDEDDDDTWIESNQYDRMYNGTDSDKVIDFSRGLPVSKLAVNINNLTVPQTLAAIRGLFEFKGIKLSDDIWADARLIELDLEVGVETGTIILEDAMYRFDLDEKRVWLPDPEILYPVDEGSV